MAYKNYLPLYNKRTVSRVFCRCISKRPGPKKKYHDLFVQHLAHLWKAMGNNDLTEETKKLLLSCSSATVDRCLKRFREQHGISGTVKSFFKNKIPMKLLEDEIKRPGFMEADRRRST